MTLGTAIAFYQACRDKRILRNLVHNFNQKGNRDDQDCHRIRSNNDNSDDFNITEFLAKAKATSRRFLI